ncbi:hypothetical protein MtrunA17_Chr4g0040941 [Medicago truncatula]|uniref:Uncharacterized protein n=1 Tax=Medicago truncatula TaxID=3880 RepID=G7ZZZ4_MEDTR|nr:hypothetical protein MTR_4g079600 [Medicago truncatula]RHN61837.1 hypothetical protein MtrunA17_Chr4g0040941 [Medicago truncatula]
MESTTSTSTISNHSNKENVPPVCKSKISIPQLASQSFKNKNKKNGIDRKLKRVPLADITNLINNSVSNSATFTLSHQPHTGVSSFISSNSLLISRKRTLKPLVSGSKSLRMGFR